MGISKNQWFILAAILTVYASAFGKPAALSLMLEFLWASVAVGVALYGIHQGRLEYNNVNRAFLEIIIETDVDFKIQHKDNKVGFPATVLITNRGNALPNDVSLRTMKMSGEETLRQDAARFKTLMKTLVSGQGSEGSEDIPVSIPAPGQTLTNKIVSVTDYSQWKADHEPGSELHLVVWITYRLAFSQKLVYSATSVLAKKHRREPRKDGIQGEFALIKDTLDQKNSPTLQWTDFATCPGIAT